MYICEYYYYYKGGYISACLTTTPQIVLLLVLFTDLCILIRAAVAAACDFSSITYVPFGGMAVIFLFSVINTI